jgi:Matrixin
MHPGVKILALALAMALATSAAPAAATNRCITADGRILYTDSRCDAVGAQPHGEVKGAISVVPLPAQKPSAPRASPAAAEEPPAPRAVFRKSPNAPTLAVCYQPKDARAGVAPEVVEASIRQAFSLWNAGCNINYKYAGQCPPDDGTWRPNPAEYKVWWESWDESLALGGDPKSYARDHAVAMASPTIGVSLNRDISVPASRLQRAIVHEFGHVVGVGHSRNPGDLMFSGGRQKTPTASDLEACNQAIERRYGIKAEHR